MEEKQEVEVKEPEPEFSLTSRQRIYDRYEKLGEVSGNTLPAESQPKEPEKEAKKETKVDTSEKVSAEPEEAQKEADREPVEDKTKKDDYQSTVPYDALHKEREKRKSAQAKAKELETQLATVLRDMKELTERKQTVDSDGISDYETEIRNLKKEVIGLKSELGNYQRETSTKENQRQMAAIKENLDRTASELSKEGYPLFIEMQHLVVDEIMKRVNEDPDSRDEIVREFDNPEGWKKVYKESVFPRLNSAFVPKKKEAEKTEKIEAKKEARLSGGPSARVETEAKTDDWTYEDYLKDRKSKIMSGRPL